jgi:hypothetical protein
LANPDSAGRVIGNMTEEVRDMQLADVPHEAGLLLALHSVQRGQITVREPDMFFDGGRPLRGVLVPFLRELFAHEQIRLEEQQEDRPSRAAITTAGENLLAELKDQTERPASDEP